MIIQPGKIYREKDKLYEKSFLVITDIINPNTEDAICRVFRLHAPSFPFKEYLDVLIDKIDELENFDD
jgi:hypothetical protein